MSFCASACAIDASQPLAQRCWLVSQQARDVADLVVGELSSPANPAVAGMTSPAVPGVSPVVPLIVAVLGSAASMVPSEQLDLSEPQPSRLRSRVDITIFALQHGSSRCRGYSQPRFWFPETWNFKTPAGVPDFGSVKVTSTGPFSPSSAVVIVPLPITVSLSRWRLWITLTCERRQKN